MFGFMVLEFSVLHGREGMLEQNSSHWLGKCLPSQVGGIGLPPLSSFWPSSSWHCWLVPCAIRMGSFSANSLRSRGALCLSLQCFSTLSCCQSRLPITERHAIRGYLNMASFLSIITSMFLHFEIYPYFTQVLWLHSNTH